MNMNKKYVQTFIVIAINEFIFNYHDTSPRKNERI